MFNEVDVKLYTLIHMSRKEMKALILEDLSFKFKWGPFTKDMDNLVEFLYSCGMV